MRPCGQLRLGMLHPAARPAVSGGRRKALRGTRRGEAESSWHRCPMSRPRGEHVGLMETPLKVHHLHAISEGPSCAHGMCIYAWGVTTR